MYHFISQPGWSVESPPAASSAQLFEKLSTPAAHPQVVERAFAQVEFRTFHVLARIETLLSPATNEVLFAKPPTDLPALLRTADQILTFARQEAGERASVWRCECGNRHAVPVSLMRPVSIRCERCGRTLDLDPERIVDEARLADPLMTEVNAYRHEVAQFFREAMARGWPVFVARAAAACAEPR
jgi:hypothetical protein